LVEKKRYDVPNKIYKEVCIKSKGTDKEKAEREMKVFFDSIHPEDEAELQAAVKKDFARIHKEIEEIKYFVGRFHIQK